MATTISMQIGAVSVQRTFQNDQMAAAIAAQFYAAQRLGEESASNQQKMLAIIDWFINQMKTAAKTRHMQQASDTAMAEAEQEYNLS